MASRLEIDIKRLLTSTESLSGDYSASSNWKLEKYVETLLKMLEEIKKRTEKPDLETFNEYTRRVDFLKKLVESQKIDNPVKKGVALQMMSHSISTPDGNISREIQQKTASKYNLDMRNELFGLENRDEGNHSELRSRKKEKSTGEDFESIIKYNQVVQEKIVSDMLLLTRDLKEHSKVANNIIQKDIETLQKSTGLTDQNLDRLKVESDKLQEHNTKAWRCWMWVLIFIVMVMFVFMVLFMKLMKKRTS